MELAASLLSGLVLPSIGGVLLIFSRWTSQNASTTATASTSYFALVLELFDRILAVFSIVIGEIGIRSEQRSFYFTCNALEQGR
jgi:hypothetical protein